MKTYPLWKLECAIKTIRLFSINYSLMQAFLDSTRTQGNVTWAERRVKTTRKRIEMWCLGPFLSTEQMWRAQSKLLQCDAGTDSGWEKSRNNTLLKTLMVYVFILTSRGREAGRKQREGVIFLHFENLGSVGYWTARVSRKGLWSAIRKWEKCWAKCQNGMQDA